ncbi:TPA: hypothetical protein DEP94_02430 [Candidatus Nomurabacteria bacterium]|nr:hypothetical protein [Candidatus Nomurabacteria bacterium]
MAHIISNFDSIATNQLRIDALSILEKGSLAIDTNLVVKRAISLENEILFVHGHKYNLKDYDKVFVFGFGKASCKAVQEIESILGNKIAGGIVIDKHISECNYVKVYKGSHPLPTSYNVEISQKIKDLAESLTEKDLAIVVVSGGGSALLCLPQSECEQGSELYSNFLKAGGNIKELNILRKHISTIKGGGLAKFLYPATVVSLVFCDVPGDHFGEVASGPTYLDHSTVADAEALLTKHNIKNVFRLNETPKEEKYFENVRNVPIVSNKEALRAMELEAKERGYEVILLGDEVYDTPEIFLKNAYSALKNKSVVIAGGELSIALKKEGGIGGRNLYTGTEALNIISDTDLFIAYASDGIDNKSVYAGAVIDAETKRKIKDRNLDVEKLHEDNKDNEIFEEIGEVIITGDTGSNVSDLYLMMRN